MPKYAWDINDLIYEEDVKAMFRLAGSIYERALISVLWITGARTEEVLTLTSDNITYDAFKLLFIISTLKLGGGAFHPNTRPIEVKRPSGLDQNLYVETVITHVKTLQKEARLFPYTSRWAEKVINRLGLRAVNKQLAPYHFRHSVFSHDAFNGMGVADIMHKKGAKDARSVSGYMHNRKYVVDLTNLRRSRHEEEKPQGG
jgi:integrase